MFHCFKILKNKTYFNHMKLTENFDDYEFVVTTHKEIDNTLPLAYVHNVHAMAKLLQKIRDVYGYPIKITSCYRCKKLNTIVNGSKTSDHLTASAADIKCSDNKKLWNIILKLRDEGKIQFGQLINEYNLKWIHISIPTEKHHNEVFSIN